MRALVLLIPLTACVPDSDEIVLIGDLDGTDAKVGLDVADGRASAYVCGGAQTRGMVDRWFEGAGDADSGELAADGWTFAWEAGAGMLTDVNGTEWPFSIEDQSGSAALYDGVDSGCRDGAIVWQGESALELQGTWGCYTIGYPAIEVTPVGTLKLDDVIMAHVETSDGPRDFDLSRVVR